jgi:hypothetical protein
VRRRNGECCCAFPLPSSLLLLFLPSHFCKKLFQPSIFYLNHFLHLSARFWRVCCFRNSNCPK